MLSVWPELFTFELIAISVLRVVVGYFFLLLGSKLLYAACVAKGGSRLLRAGSMLYSVAQIVVGGLLVAGFYTQPAALVGMLLTLVPLQHHSTCERYIQFLLFTISLSLLFLGPGVFAFDLPL
jgi:uncharacterized membrane protein YphA (DoxX/SURF4 family)